MADNRILAIPVASALAMSALAPTPAAAESIVISVRQPAKFGDASQLRKMVLGNFSGRGGSQLQAALSQRLLMPGPDGPPYFTLVNTANRASGVGVMSGDVRIDVSQSSFTRQESRCVEGAKLFSCKRSVQVTVRCLQRIALAVVNVRIVRASDQRIVYSVSKPYRDVATTCEGGAPLPDVDAQFVAASDQIATAILQEIAPHSISYKVRLLESTKGLSKAGAASFKAAVKVSTRNLPASCASWSALTAQGETNPSLVFNLGVCAEQSGDLRDAGARYAAAQQLLPGDKTIAEGINRVRTMVVAKATAERQEQQRSATEAEERRKIEADARAARAAEAAAKAAEARKVRQTKAAAAAKKAEIRQEVVRKHGAGAADAILSGTVKKGMTPSQVRAVVGSGCRIQRLSPGEEQWFCGAKRIVFSGGKVTFVR